MPFKLSTNYFCDMAFLIRSIQSLWWILSLCLLSKAVIYQPNWESIDARPLPQWYNNAKVGIFIHFGVFSVPSFVDEWFWKWWIVDKEPRIVNYMNRNFKPNFTYPEFAPNFNVELFNANEWANLFKKSGARYVVLTTKHHEGFTLWPSKFSPNWNAMDIGPKRDIVGEFSDAIRKNGLHLGLYHSWFEWFHPLYVQDKKNSFKTDKFVKFKARPELEELVKTYTPDLLWSDGDGEALDTYWNSTDFLAWLYNDSPVKDKVVVNDRWGIGTSCKHGGYYSCADRYNPGKLQQHKWENAMTIDKQSWGYRREASLSDYMTIEELIGSLVTTVSCGGNILINVGPTKDGKIIPIFEERLLQLGQWLDINGEAIYDSDPWKCQKNANSNNVWYTQTNGTVYGIVLNWPQSGFITMECINANEVNSVQMLGFNDTILFQKALTGINIYFPNWSPKIKSKYAYTFKIDLKK